MPTYPWTDAMLDAMRMEGDGQADEMAREVLAGQRFDEERGRLGYHRMLDLADRLIEAPELALVRESTVRREFERMPEAFQRFFDPVAVPAWVDERKLALASTVWDENMLAIIWVLYAASLPSCYLIAKGIPALYESGKLRDHRFIFQRIYETGLMLDAVMSPGGLRIVADVDVDARLRDQARRFVWGKGFVAARKVRLLHSSMRAMLLHPATAVPAGAHNAPGFAASSAGAITHGLAPYDVAKYGLPVNQEDMAFTLLTFGLAIPRGLDAWGCRLDADQRDAFLHAWRLVGHLMGIRDELLPHDWAAASDLYATVLRRQGGPSIMGRTLTEGLEGFLQDYLPPLFKPTLPAMLIVSQLGRDDAAKVLPTDTAKPPWWLRVGFSGALLSLKTYYALRRGLTSAFPAFGALLGETFSQAGDALVESWRDDYDRKPFYIPESADADWRSQRGVTPAFRAQLSAWRSRLFYRVLLGVSGMVFGTLLLLAIPLAWWLGDAHTASIVTLAAAGLWVLGAIAMHRGVISLVRKRPEPPSPRAGLAARPRLAGEGRPLPR